MRVTTYAEMDIIPVGNKNHICVSGSKRFIKKTAEAERWIKQARMAFIQNAELDDKPVSMKKAQKAIGEYCVWRNGHEFIQDGVFVEVSFLFSQKHVDSYKRSDLDNLLKGVLDALKVNRSGWGLIKDDRYIKGLHAKKEIVNFSKERIEVGIFQDI